MPDFSTLQPGTVQLGYRDYVRVSGLLAAGAVQAANSNGAALGAGCVIGQLINTGAAQTGTTALYDSSDGTNTNLIWSGILGANAQIAFNFALKHGLRILQTGAAQGPDILVSTSG